MVTPTTTTTTWTDPCSGLRRRQKLDLKWKLLLCSPVLVPHIVGGFAPAAPGAATENVSVRHWEWVDTGWVPAAAATPSRILIFLKKEIMLQTRIYAHNKGIRLGSLCWRLRGGGGPGDHKGLEVKSHLKKKKGFRKKLFFFGKNPVWALLYLTYPRTARADRYRALPRSQTRGSLEVGAVLAGGVAAAGNDYIKQFPTNIKVYLFHFKFNLFTCAADPKPVRAGPLALPSPLGAFRLGVTLVI